MAWLSFKYDLIYFKTLVKRTLSVKIPSDFSLREGERPVWYGRRSFKRRLHNTWHRPVNIRRVLGHDWIGLRALRDHWGVLLLIAIILLILAHHKAATTEYFITNLRTYVRYGSIVTELENSR
jgi:hypothetical protein